MPARLKHIIAVLFMGLIYQFGFAQSDITGFYESTNGDHFYIRQVQDDIYFVSESKDGEYASVFKGRRSGLFIFGKWYDIPKGVNQGAGKLRINIQADKTLLLTDSEGEFSQSTLKLIYKAPNATNPLKEIRDPFTIAPDNLSGFYEGDNQSVYYLREMEDGTVLWFAETVSNGKVYSSHVFFGSKAGQGIIRGDYIDIPKAIGSSKGSMELKISNGDLLCVGIQTNCSRISPMNGSGGREYIEENSPGTQPGEVQADNRPQGPGNQRIQLFDKIASDHSFAYSGEVFRIASEVYADKNPLSGHFYYLPDSYSLQWDEKNGYALNLQYGGSGQGGVKAYASLTSGISTAEIELVKKILKAKLADDQELHFKELLPMPLDGEPSLDMSSGFGVFDVQSGDQSGSSISDFNRPIRISWSANETQMQEILLNLQEGSLSGQLSFDWDTEESSLSRTVEVNLSLRDPSTFRNSNFQTALYRRSSWTSPFDYPVVVKRIHYLMLKEGRNPLPVVYSWEFGDQEIPPRSSVRFDFSSIPEWVERSAIKSWAEFELQSCTNCNEKLNASLSNSISSKSKKEVSIQLMNVLDQMDGDVKMEVRVRSSQLDPSGKQRMEAPVLNFEQDGAASVAGFNISSVEEPRFDYRIKLISDQGVCETSWNNYNGYSLYIHAELIEQLCGFKPGG